MKAAYIFPGQGAQFVGMGKDIYENFSSAQEIFKEANEVLGFDIAGIAFKGPAEELVKTVNAQTAILTVSVALLRVLEEIMGESLTPVAAAGLSLGEYPALVAAEAFSFGDLLLLTKKRSEFMEEVCEQFPGGMVSIIGLGKEAVEEVCKESGMEVANLNCPGQIVISGLKENIEKAIESAKSKGCRRAISLNVRGAFHSSIMKPAAERFKLELEKVEVRLPKIPVVSNVTARYYSSPEEIKENLVLHLTQGVRWEESMHLMFQAEPEVFLEIGPGKVLKGLLRWIESSWKVVNVEGAGDIMEFQLPFRPPEVPEVERRGNL